MGENLKIKMRYVLWDSDTPSEQHLVSLKRCLSEAFPLRLSDSYFQDVASGSIPTLLALDEGDQVVGQISWQEHEDGYIYIVAFAVVVSRRDEGIGSRLLEGLVGKAAELPVRLHVQSNNVGARKLYSKFGFRQVEIVPNFYRRLAAPEAVLLELSPSDSGAAVASALESHSN